MRPELYHPRTPDAGQVLWVPGSCLPLPKCEVERFIVKGAEPFTMWLRKAERDYPESETLEVPQHIIELNESMTRKCLCRCDKKYTKRYMLTKFYGVWVHNLCRTTVDETCFHYWLKQAKRDQPEVMRLRVPGEIITMREHICSCYICPCGCYTEARGGMTYFIVKRDGVFIHDYCGEVVE